MIRIVYALILALVLAGPLAACGKKGSPKPPGKSDYPRSYPKSG